MAQPIPRNRLSELPSSRRPGHAGWQDCSEGLFGRPETCDETEIFMTVPATLMITCAGCLKCGVDNMLFHTHAWKTRDRSGQCWCDAENLDKN
jgi:hypothetical protein